MSRTQMNVMQSKGGYLRRNLPPTLCAYYIRDDCPRGTDCPYRHDTPLLPIKDGDYYRVNDQVQSDLQVPPNDESTKTLLVGLGMTVSGQDLKDHLYADGGGEDIESITIVQQPKCAYITYASRQGAEKAAGNQPVIKGFILQFKWAKAWSS